MSDQTSRAGLEAKRIQLEYCRRSAVESYRSWYSPIDIANIFEKQARDRCLARFLNTIPSPDREQINLLDVGCGTGGPLLRWILLGLDPARCCGIDLLAERIELAKTLLPSSVTLCQADATVIPFQNSRFDIISQFTVFSSIIDFTMRHKVAGEMLRVLRPGGYVIWYDFWINPVNRSVRPIKKQEVRELFPDCRFRFIKITLAPPIVRRLARSSILLCEALEACKVFNTHYLAIGKKLG